MAGSLSIALAAARSASDRAGGLPPVRPLSRAALRPARVLSRIHEQLVEEGRIVWVTFHPSYSYEDFVEG
jgi:5-methylcytosine-specific restriction enzyme B